MKPFCCLTLVLAGLVPSARSATTINALDHFSYGANVGWIDWRGDAASGAVIGAFVCSGFIYSANAGWLSLGSGSPANGIRYQNDSAADCGVNHDGAGALRGYAYAANLGWLTFTNRDANGTLYEGPQVDLLTGRLSGFIWSANAGWISLSNEFAQVRTDTMDCGPDSDGDGLPDGWELQFAPNLGLLAGAGDNDGDGMSNAEEFLADTNPLDASSYLHLTRIEASPGGSPAQLTWTSAPTRQYRIHGNTDVAAAWPWPELGLGLIPGEAGSATSRSVTGAAEQRFFVIEAVKPLSP